MAGRKASLHNYGWWQMSMMIIAGVWFVSGLLMVIVGSGLLSRVRGVGLLVLGVGIASGGIGLALMKQHASPSFSQIAMIRPAKAAATPIEMTSFVQTPTIGRSTIAR